MGKAPSSRFIFLPLTEPIPALGVLNQSGSLSPGRLLSSPVPHPQVAQHFPTQWRPSSLCPGSLRCCSLRPGHNDLELGNTVMLRPTRSPRVLLSVHSPSDSILLTLPSVLWPISAFSGLKIAEFSWGLSCSQTSNTELASRSSIRGLSWWQIPLKQRLK